MTATQTQSVLNAQALLDHWQGHRRLTRRVIETFPEDKLFSFTLGSMRPFSEMVKEFLRMTEPIAHGVATGVHYPTLVPYQPAYAHLRVKPGSFPIAEDLFGNCLSLPMYPELTDEMLVHVAETLKKAL